MVCQDSAGHRKVSSFDGAIESGLPGQEGGFSSSTWNCKPKVAFHSSNLSPSECSFLLIYEIDISQVITSFHHHIKIKK